MEKALEISQRFRYLDKMKIFLSKSVIFEEPKAIEGNKSGISCIYNKKTGLYFFAGEEDYKLLKKFEKGIDEEKLSSIKSDSKLLNFIPNLIRDGFLVEESYSGREELIYANFFPCLTRFTVFHDKGNVIELAVYRFNSSGNIDFDIFEIKRKEALIFRYFNGSYALKDIEKYFNFGFENMLHFVFKLTDKDMQVLRLLPMPLYRYSSQIPPLLSPAPIFKKKVEKKEVKEGVKEYHLREIKDAAMQFEQKESTLSHLYRIKHPALGNKSYGEAFFSKIKKIKSFNSNEKSRILEIGAGVGYFSKDFMLCLKRENTSASYFICDLSLELIKSQRKMHEENGLQACYVLADAERLPFKENAFDMIISNEVIADFSTPLFKDFKDAKKELEKHGIVLTREIENMIKDKKNFRLNLGAMILIREIKHILKKNGIAIITEYGYENELPKRAEHLDHEEYTIAFSHLISVANAFGFASMLSNAFDFLGFNSEVEILSSDSFKALFRILERNNIYLPNMAYTRVLLLNQLKNSEVKLRDIKNLRFVKISREPIEIIKFLLLRKAK